MKSIAALAFLAAAVAAQSPEELRAQIPKCALSCIEKAAEDAGCKSGDFACECEKQEELTAAATTCQLALDESEQCDTKDLGTALEVADKICEAVKAGGDDSEGDDDSKTDEPTTATSAEASSTKSSADTEKTDEAEKTDDEAKPSSTDSSDDAEESGSADGGDDEDSEDSEGGDDDSAAMKLGSYGWAGAAAAAVALVF